MDWDDILIAEWRRSSFVDFLKYIPRHLLLRFKYFYKGMSPTFICFLLVVNMVEAHYVCEAWRELKNLLSYFLVSFMGNDYAIYAIVYPDIQQIVPPRQHHITLTVSTFADVLAAKLPYILAFVDLELRPSFFTVRGLASFLICFLTEADIYIFHWHPGRPFRVELYPQLYWQSCLRFLVFVGLIVVGGANIIDKAWHGALVFHKHVLIPLSLCVFAYTRFCEKYRRLRRMMKKAMTVVPIDEKND